MAQAEKSQNKLTQQDSISRSNNNFPQVLLQSLPSGNYLNHNLHDETEEDEEKEIELSLGLSLNGRFGVDPRSKKLTRSSSIPDFNNLTRDIGSAFMVPVKSTNLLRTCSLPTETEEECRKRKEIQCLRRMEAKRKRSEKLRNLKAMKGRNWGFGVEGCEDGKTVKNGTLGNTDNQPTQGTNKHTETRSPASIQSSSECEQKSIVIPGSTFTEKLGSTGGVSTEDKRHDMTAVIANGAKEMVRNVLEDMPFVSTKVDGPNGKRIEGFLYRYTRGEEVRIVCVCHGSFLTPAEFVKHAGGGDVANPLKHIVVNPSLF